MVEIIALSLLAAGCVGAFLTVRVCAKVLGVLERLEASVRALSSVASSAAETGRGNAQQERYEQGVANILAYGTREMLRRRGEAQ